MIVASGMALVGFVLLTAASDRFVAGAAVAAFRMRISPVVVGAVIIGFGTSSPEFFVSTLAAAEGSRDIAIGNLVGSNVANLTLVLGLLAILVRPTVTSGMLMRELPLVVGAMALLAIVLRPLGRFDGILLLAGFAAALVLVLRAGRVGDDELGREAQHEVELRGLPPMRRVSFDIAFGLLGTVAGAQMLVWGARTIAEEAGLSQGLIGFTLVAVGTSLPELATTVQAGRKGEAELAIGNALGSNLFNSLAIGGTVALISPGPVAAGLTLAALVAVGVGVVVWILMRTTHRLVRWEGVLLMAVYVALVPLAT